MLFVAYDERGANLNLLVHNDLRDPIAGTQVHTLELLADRCVLLTRTGPSLRRASSA